MTYKLIKEIELEEFDNLSEALQVRKSLEEMNKDNPKERYSVRTE